jgi:hypothetical protein
MFMRLLKVWRKIPHFNKAIYQECSITEWLTQKGKRYPTLTANSAVALNRRRACVLTGFTGYDLYATRIVMQPCLHGCSILPSWREKAEFSVLMVAWHSICEAEISVPDQFLV